MPTDVSAHPSGRYASHAWQGSGRRRQSRCPPEELHCVGKDLPAGDGLAAAKTCPQHSWLQGGAATS